MIIGRHRRAVIQRIASKAKAKHFNDKVELNDPTLTPTASKLVIARFWHHQSRITGQISAAVVRSLLTIITPFLTTRVKIIGQHHLPKTASALITCNHYNQLDILPIKKLAMRRNKRLYFMVEDTNLVMHFPIGLLVRNADSIPVTTNLHYLGRVLPQKIKQILTKPAWILVYPEQQMWFNYRRIRPFKKGAYYFAAKFNLPIISCFVEIQNCQQKELFHRDFYKTRCVLHVLPTIYPDSEKSIAENTKLMRKQDYQQKKAAYERIYGKKIDQPFTFDDIAGLK
ncbi:MULTISPECIES: 1-acyl-sn-glycerol-3-phosphate acyltransferase [Lactobacillus]|uniref:1-acyl-sn-glycerol-3-phosphate acyltransferase n=1 Tax=Lactobacillus xujianguonis TaxID=2495899 RepID=A0A437STX9_9LACO|nr:MULTISPECIES: lysophospholipid acyltransferase family protein [Lactobacillus]RVU70401.1 1-acyl-sn-glycerol-3-phosphate acyltransferase [Lactobacillus xujianguonis]RVU73648.1 1-acyl-sn-glycerol-3-phosphate acyltransferase [Lactobacillus xujianguonis]